MGDINVKGRILKTSPLKTGDDDELRTKEPNSDLATSDDPFPPTIVSNTSNLVPSDARRVMSDSSIPHANPQHPRTQHNNPQRRSTPHSAQPLTNHSLPSSPQVSIENTQHSLPANFPRPSLHYSASPPPQGHGGVYIGQYTMSPQSIPMGTVHSPPPFAYSHIYHHPTVSDSSSIPQNLHSHYQPHSHAGTAYQYQTHSQANSPLDSSFSRTGSASMYPTHQANPLPTTSSHPTSPPAQNTSSYIGSGVFHSLQYPSPMSTPHYTYSPPFPGTPPYQSQYPPQFSQHYTANRDGEPQGDWYYVPRRSPAAPSQQYDPGQSYSGHYPTTYPQVRPELPYNAHSFSSVGSSTPYASHPLSQQSEPVASEIRRAISQPSDSEHLPSDKPIVRQPYHPNPPPHRSEWVMWAGNIPSDATHDEIYRFFNQAPGEAAFESTPSMGVVSVFVISRSNCAFINFETESCLLEAISRFNGVSLRPDDPRCARLVCRVRRKDDDLKAGVGGQRGTGMHTRWVKEQKQKAQEKTKDDQSDPFDRRSTSPSSVSEQLDSGNSKNLSVSSDNSEFEQNVHAKHSSTSESYSSSNSSFLARHFPTRYFILKSLTQHDLDLSVQTGFWATQKHNEGILDQSYRTSKDVFLIFGANKSGEFYGYARMAGPVRRGGQSIHWTPSPPRSSQSPTSSRLSSEPLFFSPGDHRLVDASPLPDLQAKTSTDQHLGQKSVLQHQSAPAMLGTKYDLPSMKTPEMKFSLGQQQARSKTKSLPPEQNEDFELDPSAPVRAMRSGKSDASRPSLHSLEVVEEGAEELGDDIQEGPSIPQQHSSKEEESWGDCFAVEWISTEKLPFSRTRQLRNPWNHDREVKVSRDGTELEPTVGKKLLEEWHKLSEPQSSTLVDGVDGYAGHVDGLKPAGSSSKRSTPHLTIVTQRAAGAEKAGEKAG